MAEERRAAAVVADIIGNVQDIIRSELRLAKAELKAGASQASAAGGFIATGLGLSFYATGLLLAMLVLILARFLDAWLATLIVFVVVSAIAAVLVLVGLNRWKKLHMKPEKTVRSVRENASWLKTQLK
jgi:uncharacterized membrane protein YqjE